MMKPSIHAAELEKALRDLVVEVGYADGQWLRHTDTFARACALLGIESKPGLGLFEVVQRRIPEPPERP